MIWEDRTLPDNIGKLSQLAVQSVSDFALVSVYDYLYAKSLTRLDCVRLNSAT